jgi:hypothetical protein
MRKWLLIAIAACGPNNQLTFEEYAAQAPGAYCAYFTRCGLFPDQATCEHTQLGIRFTADPNAAAAIGSGKINFDGGAAGACLAAISGLACNAALVSTTPPACFGVATGTVGSGGTCASNDECISQKCDVPSCPDACCQGTCVGGTAPVPGATGMPCGIGETTPACVDGDFCNFQTGSCAPFIAEGSACMDTEQCAPGLGCVGTPLTCKQLPDTGAACPDHACANIGEHCGSAGTCVKDGLPGDTCTINSDCSPFFPCDSTGHCATGPGLGQPCPMDRCFDVGTYCTSETGSAMPTCVAAGSDGAPCTQNDQCVSNTCTGSACMTPAACF